MGANLISDKLRSQQQSDDDVELYQYDYVYDNNCSLKETEGYFLKYLYKILSETRTISPEVQDKNRKNRCG